MTTTRRRALQLFGFGAAATGLHLPLQAHEHDDDDDDGLRSAQVFTATNSPAGNEVRVYGSAADGTLVAKLSIATQGLGTGAGLGNQGAVTLSRDGRFLFVVNAASNTVSTFAVRCRGLVLRSVVDSGGLQPISITEHRGVVVVLNAGGAGNVAGFRNLGGHLQRLPGAVQPLSAAGGVGPAQVGFDPWGELLLVTEKATNRLTTYRVGPAGRIAPPNVVPAAGLTPFGFAFDARGRAIVSEAAGGAAGASATSSYAFADDRPVVISASVPTTQTAACWVALGADGRTAYVMNAGSASVSRYRIQRSGQITLAQAVAATTDPGPIDAAASADGRFLYVLTGTGHAIDAFAIGSDGSLTPAGRATGLPPGTNGLAAN